MNTSLSSHSAQSLKPFDTEPRLKISFSVARNSTSLEFTFVLTGGLPIDLAEIVIPELKFAEDRERRDELWKQTCFEIFVGCADQRSYLEFNLSPSGDWNAYSFDTYRKGMKPVSDSAGIEVSHHANPQSDIRTWSASIVPSPAHSTKGEDGELAQLLKSRSLVLGATAVIEYQDGSREYWALTHAGEKPDFHLRESFKLIL